MVQTINNKAQFFIASAVVIMAATALIFYTFNDVQRVDASHLDISTNSYFSRSLLDAAKQTLELTLQNVSLTPKVYFDQNTINPVATEWFIKYFELAKNLSLANGMNLNYTFTHGPYTNQSLNALFNLTIESHTSRIVISKNVTRAINVTIFEVTSTEPCMIKFNVTKEYNDPILIQGVGAGDSPLWDFKNASATLDADCTLYLRDPQYGYYNITCSNLGCGVGPKLYLRVQDTRNIHGYGFYG
jgi:hypothetical protein